MSDADATDPVKALREWCAILYSVRGHLAVIADAAPTLNKGLELSDAACVVLRSAPALLARIEAGEAELSDIRARLCGLATSRLDGESGLAAATMRKAGYADELQARLAEVAPVVEAARAYVAWSKPQRDRAFMAGGSAMTAPAVADLVCAVQDYEDSAARSLRGAGEGGVK